MSAPVSPSIYVPNIDDVHADASTSNLDPFKFSHGLTSVDQPANYLFVHVLIATALVPVLLAIISRIFTGIRNDRRRISVITSRQSHDFWKTDRYSSWGLLKRHFLYAAAWTNWHNRKSRTSNTVDTGALPTRPQATIIIIYVISNVAYCLAISAQHRAQELAEFRGRCGTLAAFNMIFTVLFALRNNPLIWMLHVSYDTFNLFHRWLARLVVFESLAHVLAFTYNAYHVTYDGKGGWHSIGWIIHHSRSYRWGLAAFVTLSLLMGHSVAPLQHAFYEMFLMLHRIGVAVAVSGIYFHLAKHALPQLPWVYLSIALLVLELLARIIRIFYSNFSWKPRILTPVILKALPGEATRVTFSVPRSWNAKTGSYVHVYLPSVAFLSSHPFSVAWSQSSPNTKLASDQLPPCIYDLMIEQRPNTISCIVRARTGMTLSLYKMAAKTNDLKLWGAIEGPYGGYLSLDSYGTVVLFAAGVGITHQLPFVRHLLAGHNSSTSATQKVLLIWCISSLEAYEWIRPWLEELDAMQNFHEVVRIRLYISKMTWPEIRQRSLPAYLDVRPQRCDPQEAIDKEVLAQVGAMIVSVCGPSGFSNSVREAVRHRVCIRSIDFFEEAFSY